MEEAGKDAAMPEVNRRVQAMLLTRRGGKENLDKARQILEELVLDPKRAAPADRLRLARLYEADGKVDPARQQYLKLVDSRESPPPRTWLPTSSCCSGTIGSTRPIRG